MAEFDGKPNPKLFKDALVRFEESSEAMARLQHLYDQLISIHKKAALVKEFDLPLRQILKDSPPMERVSMEDLRYSNVAKGVRHPMVRPLPPDLLAIMEDQRSNLRVLKRQLDVTIEAFREVIPYAEKGEFASMMLSGRRGFADKIQQSVNLLGVFGRYYTSSCMTTIAATMQAYPAGLKWLKDNER